jgi:glycosyltransferase involved in cell wall biosynthesis
VRVMFLSTSMGMGGADQQLLTGAQELIRRGHTALIVSLTPLGPMGFEARELGIRTESLDMPRGVPDPRALWRLRRLVREWRPDVLHSHMVHANLMARALRLVIPVPAVVSTIHNVYEGGALLMTGYRATNRLVDRMTIISDAAAERFIRERIVPARLLEVIPNGVDGRRFRAVASGTRERLRAELDLADRFAWLAVGRFETAKDYPTMLHAFAEVHRGHPQAVLLVVGRGALQEETAALVQSLGLADAVRFLGVRRDVPEVMAAADGYVMSSAWEGMPMVLLEAGAAGLPIVATAVGGNRDVVLEGDTGYLVPPRDPGALGGAMKRLMALPADERRRMGARGRDHVEARFGLAQVAERWEAVYLKALAARGRPVVAPDLGGSHQSGQPPVESAAAAGLSVSAADRSGGQRNT